MSHQEIANAIRKDWNNELFDCYADCFGKRKHYGRFILNNVKSEEFHYLGRREKITKSKNKYVFLFYTHGRKQYKKEGVLRSFRLEYLRRDGIHVAKINIFNQNEVTFYTPHFFDRYRERFLEPQFEIDDWTKEDVIDDYFMNNVAEVATNQNNPKYSGGIFVSTDNGVILGSNLGEDLWEYRTFISFDMLKGQQINLSNEEEELAELIRMMPKNIDINSLINGSL